VQINFSPGEELNQKGHKVNKKDTRVFRCEIVQFDILFASLSSLYRCGKLKPNGKQLHPSAKNDIKRIKRVKRISNLKP